jgi:hypothetical protein
MEFPVDRFYLVAWKMTFFKKVQALEMTLKRAVGELI